MSTKSIAIIGATGFVGNYFTRYFVGKGYKVYAFGRREKFVLEDLVQHYYSWDISEGKFESRIQPDIVINCAGSVTHWGQYTQMHKVNTIGTRNIINSFPKAKFIHISTASIYDPFKPKDLITENTVKPIKYLNSYQETKWEAEQEVVNNCSNYIIFRPHAVYGKNDTTIFPRLIRARKPKLNKFLLIGDGKNRVSLTYVGNLALAVELAINYRVKNQIYNIADTKNDTLINILDKFKVVNNFPEKYLKINKHFAWSLAHILEVNYKLLPFLNEPILTRYVVMQLSSEYTLDITKAKQELNYHPKENYLNKFQECYGS
ncbi:MAG: NAD(P)-dependent oxidoreductase [Patescibacteria group bacterium]